MTADRLSHSLRQANIVRDHSAISNGANLLQSKPDLQSAKSARVLYAIVDVVGYLLLKMIVRWVVSKCCAKRFGIAHECASCLEWRVEPFVRINRNGIRLV